MDAVIDELQQALEARRLEVEHIDGTFNLTQGRGLAAHKANVDPSEILGSLNNSENNRPKIAGWANGVKGVLLEPKRSKAADWSFEKTAGRLYPNLENTCFSDGVRAVTHGDEPWTTPFIDDIVIVYYIQLDMGMRVLTKSQVDAWSANPDRIHSAARSLLFHRTRSVEWKPVEDHPELHRLSSGDSYDAVRALVFSDVFFSRVNPGLHFAIPGQDTLVFSNTGDERDALKAFAQKQFMAEETPLSTRLFTFEVGRPVPAEH